MPDALSLTCILNAHHDLIIGKMVWGKWYIIMGTLVSSNCYVNKDHKKGTMLNNCGNCCK